MQFPRYLLQLKFLQFYREVISNLLNSPSKIDWKSCILTKQEEEKVAAKYRKEFEEYVE